MHAKGAKGMPQTPRSVYVRFKPGPGYISYNFEESKSIMNENELSYKIIGLALIVHSQLGPGLLESSYKECLYHELSNNGFYSEKEKAMPLIYKDIRLDCGYRIDLVVDHKLVIEIKSVDALHDVHLAQTLTYLKLGNYKLGLLMNFNVARLTDGIKRVVNRI
jgi:GxxExxY protein